jgi:hypothetical protein
MHWYSRDARKLLREVEEMEREERESRLCRPHCFSRVIQQRAK